MIIICLKQKHEVDIRWMQFQIEMTRWPKDPVSKSEWSERDALSDPCHYGAATPAVGSALVGILLLPRHA